jgi:hypothetical protein
VGKQVFTAGVGRVAVEWGGGTDRQQLHNFSNEVHAYNRSRDLPCYDVILFFFPRLARVNLLREKMSYGIDASDMFPVPRPLPHFMTANCI